VTFVDAEETELRDESVHVLFDLQEFGLDLGDWKGTLLALWQSECAEQLNGLALDLKQVLEMLSLVHRKCSFKLVII
jgi:hypothetical protein